MKLCGKCSVIKKKDHFYKCLSRPDGLQTECKACQSSRGKIWRDNNVERRRIVRARYRANNKKQIAITARRYQLAHPEICRKAQIEFQKKNRAYVNARTKEYEANRIKAMPKWANAFFIEEAYELATLRSNMLGFKWHVDHIVPLRSPLVCGLHTHTNIQVIPATENIRKGNKCWPQMPD